MRYRLFLRAAVALLILLVVILVVGAAQAQTVPAAPAAPASDILSSILAALLAALPALFIAGWAWIKAHAAASAATWDDEAVALVEKIAQSVVNANAAGKVVVAGAPAAATPLTGLDK